MKQMITEMKMKFENTSSNNKNRKPDYLDFDGDGNESESMVDAIADKTESANSNIDEESGTGGDTSKSEKYQIGIKNRDTSGEKNSMYGRSAVQEQNLRWYTNGDKNIYITEGTQPNNFNPGRSNLKRNPIVKKLRSNLASTEDENVLLRMAQFTIAERKRH